MSRAGFTPPSQGGFLIAKVHQVSGRVFQRLLKDQSKVTINPAQGRILFALWQAGTMSVTDLGKATALKPSTLTSMLDRLEKAGLVRREPSRDDRRILMIERTEADRDLEAEYARVSRSMTGIFYKGMKREEIHAFEATLRRVLGNLEEAEAGRGRSAKGGSP